MFVALLNAKIDERGSTFVVELRTKDSESNVGATIRSTTKTNANQKISQINI